MEGLEKGLPVPMNPGPGVVFVQHSAEGFVGRMIASSGRGLNIREGTTLVDHMNFVSSTLKFTSAIYPVYDSKDLVQDCRICDFSSMG
jgi:hypothetical protein